MLIFVCHQCSAKNALLPDQLGRAWACRKCNAPLDLSPEARQAAEDARRKAKDFLNGDQLVGKQLGVFHLDQVVGRGAMGVVYRAHDTVLDRVVAVKVLPPPSSGQEELQSQSLLHEARMAGKLVHPYVVQVFQIGQDEPYRYIVMEFLPGQSLAARLRQEGPLDVPTVVRFTTQIAQALKAAHDVGIIHRDLKPGNLLQTLDNEVKVADFGLAMMATADANARGQLAGTLPYCAPEVLDAQPATSKSDLFSLGAVVYELLTGEPPFGKQSREALLSNIRSQPAPDLSAIRHDVPDKLAQLVQRLLSKQPALRPTAVEVYDVLRKINLRKFTRRMRASFTSDTDDSGFEPPPAPYITPLKLSRFPFLPLRGAREAYLWPALRDTLSSIRDRHLRSSPVVLVAGQRGSGRTTLALLVGTALNTPPIRLNARKLPQPSVVESVLSGLTGSAEGSASGSAWVMPAVDSVRLRLRAGGRPDPGFFLEMQGMIAQYQATYSAFDPLLVVIDGMDEQDIVLPEDLQLLVEIASKSTLRIMLLTSEAQRKTLAQDVRRAMRDQYMAAEVTMPAMATYDVQAFLHHRLTSAGGRPPLPLIDDRAGQLLADESEGLPGPLEQMLHHCLCEACATAVDVVQVDHVLRVMEGVRT